MRLWEAVARFKRGIVLDEQAAPGTPSSGQVAVYANTSGVPYAKDDAGNTQSLANNVPIPFHITGSATTGVKKPQFIAPVAMTVTAMYAVCDSGSGTALRPSKNKGTTDGTILSSIGTSVLNNAQSLSLAAGDCLSVNITTAGTGSDLSITFWAKIT